MQTAAPLWGGFFLAAPQHQRRLEYNERPGRAKASHPAMIFKRSKPDKLAAAIAPAAIADPAEVEDGAPQPAAEAPPAPVAATSFEPPPPGVAHSGLDAALGRKKGVHKTLVARDMVKTYRGRNVVNHVSIRVDTGEIVGLLGPNGAGKTTTFYMTIGLVTPNGGQILLDGEDITRLPIYRRARLGIGYLSQESSVFKKLTVEENILLVWEAVGVPERQQRQMLEPLLREFNIHHIRKQKGFVLSGGERRRCEVARALAGNPDFIMLDEPFTGIDPVTIESLKEIISSLRDKGLGILITDHNVRETLSICDRAYIMMDGQVLVEGNPHEVAANEMARKYFLGEQFRLD
jgi:lipopolysaccharide export system ATP-binding protein